MDIAPAPEEFGLPAKTVLEQVDDNTIAIVIDRKSRLIMSDGKKVFEKAKKIKSILPEATVTLKTTAPVCSKTITFLQGKGIEIS